MAATASERPARRPRTRRAAARLLAAGLAAVAVTGCGGSDESDDASQSRSAQPSASSSAERTSSPAPKPTVSAADGRDADACADGDCEIAVSKPVTVRLKGPSGEATLSVTEVGPNKVEYTVKSGNGQSKGGASGPGQGCITVIRGNGSGTSCGRVPTTAPSAQPDAVVLQMAAGEDGTALLHIVST